MFRWVCLAVGVVALGYLGWYLYDLRASRSSGSAAVTECACPAEKATAAPPAAPAGSCRCDENRRSCECERQAVRSCECNDVRPPAVSGCECAPGAAAAIVVIESDQLVTPPPAPAFVPRCPPAVPNDGCGCARTVCPTLNGHRAQLTFTGTDADPSLRWLGCGHGWFLVDGCGKKTAIYP